MRALVIDDCKVARRVLDRILRGVGFQVVEAWNGEDALARLPTLGPLDIILVDWHMPRMAGPEVARAIRADPRYNGVPVLMVTAEADADHVARALAAGADEYVMKPVTPDTLRSKLELLGVLACRS